MTMSTAPATPPGKAANISCTSSSPPYPRNTSEKNDAPMRMKNTIDVVLSVLWMISRSTFKLSAR